ncbi:protealysin inhibitor emfourin [Actinoallomurus bryophytorum]|uniref:protealysin inhibitor emfourin n=1 Tax=Actinoallomurus bryophytorum TaxID=1490222 RepID=UPI001151664D|nr:protealysin inhibitor emfourin [Actinoallomurus bryophytorum]
MAVTRSGGFAGLVRRAEVDSADHPAVAGLIDDVRLDEVPEPKPEPDRFVYDIQIGDHSAQVSEADLRGPLRELVDHVMTHGRRPPSPAP